jgi:hypothetical protein
LLRSQRIPTDTFLSSQRIPTDIFLSSPSTAPPRYWQAPTPLIYPLDLVYPLGYPLGYLRRCPVAKVRCWHTGQSGGQRYFDRLSSCCCTLIASSTVVAC